MLCSSKVKHLKQIIFTNNISGILKNNGIHFEVSWSNYNHFKNISYKILNYFLKVSKFFY